MPCPPRDRQEQGAPAPTAVPVSSRKTPGRSSSPRSGAGQPMQPMSGGVQLLQDRPGAAFYAPGLLGRPCNSMPSIGIGRAVHSLREKVLLLAGGPARSGVGGRCCWRGGGELVPAGQGGPRVSGALEVPDAPFPPAHGTASGKKQLEWTHLSIPTPACPSSSKFLLVPNHIPEFLPRPPALSANPEPVQP